MHVSAAQTVTFFVWLLATLAAGKTLPCMIASGYDILQTQTVELWICYDKDIDKYKCGPVVIIC